MGPVFRAVSVPFQVERGVHQRLASLPDAHVAPDEVTPAPALHGDAQLSSVVDLVEAEHPGTCVERHR